MPLFNPSGGGGSMSAAEILTAIKTVDGATSGLDADLLDGLEAAAFALVAAAVPAGGDEETVLRKVSGDDYDVEWGELPAPEPGLPKVAGGGSFSETAYGAATFGFAQSSTIGASGFGALAHGHTDSLGGNMTASGAGAAVHGKTGASGVLTAAGAGSAVSGFAYGGTIAVSGDGSSAFGISGGSITVPVYAVGSFAGGITSPNGTIHVRAGQSGQFAFGRAYADPYETGGSAEIYARNNGALAIGESIAARAASSITADGGGGFAFGFANGYDYAAKINSDGGGSFAGGSATGYDAAAGIYAVGVGSMAFGYTTGGEIRASGYGSVQFGVGENTVDSSVAVGAYLRLNGYGAPGTPRNGDIWVANDYVYIRSNGASVKIT